MTASKKSCGASAAVSGSLMLAATFGSMWNNWATSTPSISSRFGSGAARPRPVITFQKLKPAESTGVCGSPRCGATASAWSTRRMPLPKYVAESGDPVKADANRAFLAASIFSQPCQAAMEFLYFCNQSAAAAAICGVAEDVPAPSISTMAPQLISAHDEFGVYAASAESFILLCGP